MSVKKEVEDLFAVANTLDISTKDLETHILNCDGNYETALQVTDPKAVLLCRQSTPSSILTKCTAGGQTVHHHCIGDARWGVLLCRRSRTCAWALQQQVRLLLQSSCHSAATL